MNFPSTDVEFDVPTTHNTPRSSWNRVALIRYAITSITSFAALPLQIVTILGGLSLLMTAVFGSNALMDKIFGRAVDGFMTVILLILLLGSILMISIGLIGTYVGRIYDQVKRRPLFFIDYRRSTLEIDD